MTNLSEELLCSQALWNGSIPAQFSLSSYDITTLNPPDPVYVLLSRMSYLPVTVADVVEYFKATVADFQSDIWFEFNGKPLKAHLPIGVIFDLVFDSKVDTLPWEITIHYSGFPSNELIKCGTATESLRMYSHSLKQALYLLSGSTRAFNELNIGRQSQLLEGIRTGNRGMFEEIARDLRPSEESVRLVPVRILRPGQVIIQRNISLHSKDKDPFVMSLLDVLVVMSVLQCPQSESGDASPERSSLLPVDSKAPDLSLPNCAATASNASTATSGLSIVIQGVTVPLEAPLYPLWRLFAHPDFFLYICIIISS